MCFLLTNWNLPFLMYPSSSPALPPLHGRPALKSPLHEVPASCQPPPPPPAVVCGPECQKSVKFYLPTEVPSWQNPHSAARDRRICSALLRHCSAVPSGGSTVALASPRRPHLVAGTLILTQTLLLYFRHVADSSISCVYSFPVRSLLYKFICQ